MSNEEEDKVEWLSDANTVADGFWNPNGKPSEGSKMVGILLLHRVSDAKGKKLTNPFYIFELTEDLTRDAQIDHKPVAKLAKGQLCGVSAWKCLQGITRRMGHKFWIEYRGKRKIGEGKTLVDLKLSYSRKMVKEVEKLSVALTEEGDTDGT